MTEYIAMTHEQFEAVGERFDAIRARVVEDLGDADRNYIYKILRIQRTFEIAGRLMMYVRPLRVPAVISLTISKMLDNWEIGHNVMHGQYDWMREPGINSRDFEWDTLCPSDQWKHSHNYRHHTHTNILELDRDIGYGYLRMAPEQEWGWRTTGNLVFATILMLMFRWGIMIHDLETDLIFNRKRKWADVRPLLRGIRRKAFQQLLKDYLLFPVLTGRLFFPTLTGNMSANLLYNVLTFSILFTGHFPDGVQMFTKEETLNESRGQWYVRQMLGSANVKGSEFFRIFCGSLNFQIEHHLFPDLPSWRYPKIAKEVRSVCSEIGLPYNIGSLRSQLGSAWSKIARLSLPNGLINHEPKTRVLFDAG